MVIGYTAGVFDLFHIGHVNILRNAKSLCDKLVVGVTVDELVLYKEKSPVIPFHERIDVVRACKYVDAAIPQLSINKAEAVEKLNAQFLFVGDDWYAQNSWQAMEEELAKLNCEIVYFPYTQGTSSSLINETLLRLRGE